MNYGRIGIKQKKKKLNSATTKLGTKFGIGAVKLLLIFATALIVGGSCFAFGSFQGIISNAPDISTIDISPEGFATKIYDCNGNEIQTLATTGSNRISVGIEQIPLYLQHAFVAIEDERFYEHNGIDIKGIIRAGVLMFSSGEMSQGASTLTQQLLKNNVFNAYDESTMEKIKRKIQEQYLAVKLETVTDKNTILENYMNTINLGNGYYGVQAAANGYFGKDVSELTISESAVIASITQNPTKWNPVLNPESNQERQRIVLGNMLKQGYISQAEYDEAVADDVYARIESLDVTGEAVTYSYFVDEVIEQAINDLMEQRGYTEAQATNLIYKGGLQILSTQDMSMQAIADSVINDPDYYPSSTSFSINYALSVKELDGSMSYYSEGGMKQWFADNGKSFSLTVTSEETAQGYVDEFKAAMTEDGAQVMSESLSYTIQPQVSFTVMDQATGYVKVIVGGRGDKAGNRTFNRATGDSTRQPGSSIKPLVVYGPGLDTGAISLASAIDDAPFYYPGTDQLVKNYVKGQYVGLMTVRAALTASQNIVAVKILQTITPQVGFNYLEKFGISTLVAPKNAINGNHDVVLPLALGGMTNGVTNIDMTAAYSAIANKGTYTKPVYYTQILDRDGNILVDHTTSVTHSVLKETSAWLLTSGLESVVTSGTGSAARISNQPVAGKTGTTENDTDIWFCGFTPYYTASIWVGYDDNSKAVGGSIPHTRIWSAIMSQIHENLETGSFEQPEGIVQVQVCSQSGLLPVEGLCDSDPRGSQIITEYFDKDNVPTETCTTHVQVTICNASGEIANSSCTDTSTSIMIKKASTDALNPDGKSSGYSTADAEYVITEDKLKKLCSIHNHSTRPTTTNTTSPTTTSTPTTTNGNSSSSGTSATKPSTSVRP